MCMKTYAGSCHCGAVRFECEADLSQGTNRCNCSFCRKARFWMAIVPTARVRVVAGQDMLNDYQHGKTPFLHFFFCSRCGVRPFTKGGHLPALGSDFYAVNIGCFDNATDEELAKAPVRFVDGRNDNFGGTSAETRYL